MRRGSSWLVIAGVALVAALALVDALPERERASEPEREAKRAPLAPPVIDERASLAEELRRSGVGGTLFLADDDCRLWGFRFPSLEPVWDSPYETHDCRFDFSRRGALRFGGNWQTHGPLNAIAHQGFVDVFGPRSFSNVTGPRGFVFRVRGRTPAWKPDGTLTYVWKGDVLELGEPCPRDPPSSIAEGPPACARTILAKRELAAALRRDPSIPHDRRLITRFSVSEMRWLDETRVAVVIDVELRFLRREQVVAVFDRRRLVGAAPGIGSEPPRILVSPRGSFFAVKGTRLLLFDRNGRRASFDRFAPEALATRWHRDGVSIAWSPDERWAALAARSDVYVFPTDAHRGPIRLPVRARELDWW